MTLETEYDEYRIRKIDSTKNKRCENLISYSTFLMRKGTDRKERDRLANIRAGRLAMEAQQTPMPPLTFTEDRIDGRVK